MSYFSKIWTWVLVIEHQNFLPLSTCLGNMKNNFFSKKKAVFQKLSIFSKFVKTNYNLKLIILSGKIAYKYKQIFGTYNYKQKLIIS